MPTFDTPSPIAVIIDIIGDVRVSASDRTDTVVTVRPRDPASSADVTAADQIVVELVDGTLHVRAPKRWTRLAFGAGTTAIDLLVELPSGSSVDASTGMGDLRGDGELGTCRLKSGMGSIHFDGTGSLRATTGFGSIVVDHVAGPADVHTGTGEVRLGRVDGATVVKNANGLTNLGTTLGDTRVKTANGEVVIEHAHASVVAKSSNGDVRVLELHRGTAVMESSVGQLEVGIPPGVAAWLDLDSKYGTVRNELDASDGPGDATSMVEVRAHTTVGNVVVRRTTSESAR